MTTNKLDTDEVAKLVDTTYKNILDKFNPSARQLIAAGKAYLKALHGASAASKAYLEALSRLGSCATESASHGASDIGETLNDIVQTYSEIRNHELTLLKAFYVDLVAPMETNIEKDWRVVQAEHKRFTAHWRTLQDSFGRAQVGVKKSQKKLKNSKSSTMLDKEIKQIQRFDEEKIKCEMFLEKSLKDVMTQERRRYGFVLERQCSLAKHFHALHRTGESCLGPKLEQWNQVAQTREKLRSDVDNYFGVEPSQFESASSKDSSAMLKRNRSVDSSVLTSPDQCRLMRTRSNYELHSSTSSLHMMSDPVEPEVPSAGPIRPAWDTDSSDSASAGSHSAERPLVRAIYAYLSSGEHQLSFHQGDVIACIGERNKGWQFGENVRTRRCGWFPAAYTEPVTDSASSQGSESSAEASAPGSRPRSLTVRPEEAPLSLSTFRPSPPGALPTPSRRPTSVHAELTSRLAARKLKPAGTSGQLPPPPPPPPLPPEMKRSQTTPVLNGPADTSLHSSNDSGFGADQHPPAPEQFSSDPRSTAGGGLPQTRQGWLIFSQGDDTELLRPYLGPSGNKGVQFTEEPSSGEGSRSASLLDHFVTIDRKARRRASRARLGRKASLLRAFRPTPDQPLSSDELWRTPEVERSGWSSPPATIPEEPSEPGRTSPRSLSESDLLDLDSGDTLLLVQDYRALTVAGVERRATRGGEKERSKPGQGMEKEGRRAAAVFAEESAVEHLSPEEPVSLPVERAPSSRRSPAGSSMFPGMACLKSAGRARRSTSTAPLQSMTNVIGDDPEPVSLPVDIHACAARRRRAVDVARRRTVGALVSERPSALAVSTARKHDTVSIFQTDAEYEELRYDAAPAPAPAPVSSGAGRRRSGSSELRRHHSVAAPSVSEKLRQFNIDLFNYGSYLSRRLYLPEKDSKLEETEEGQRCGPWYDLWAADSSCRKQAEHGEAASTAIHQ
ncbi:uncharacterized protein LOC122391616 [Amphibalanus amphitrite]|uniref:uncharacterized protein LOC122391616 n=1 Tax=Amphibalanus amphitrite TaxID=1232801 RepID=UPI001C92264C|nr:uncharacterized protein LOC122391616 [Amphibalanus amphitrite]